MKTNSLSKREKTLLFILLCLLVIVVGWYFLISPALDKNKTLQKDYEAVNTQFQIDKELVKTYGDLDAANEKAASDVSTYKAIFYDYVTTEDIDKLLTGLVQKYALVPVTLTLEEAVGQEISPYSQDKKEDETNQETKETKEDENAIIKVMSVKQSISTAKLSGNTADYIEAIRQLPGIHITSLSYSSSDQNTVISLEYKIYMLEK